MIDKPDDISVIMAAIGVTGTAVGAMGLALRAALKKKGYDQEKEKSGDVGVKEWELRIEKIVRETVGNVLKEKIEEHLEKLRTTSHGTLGKLQEVSAATILIREDVKALLNTLISTIRDEIRKSLKEQE